MPFGQKPDPTGGAPIDFDRIYHEAIEPAIEAAGMQSIRADRERTGGIIHKPMFERLLLCEYALADLTTANANVFYELGVRHAARPRTTLAIFACQQPIPFDVSFVQGMPYDLGPNNRFGSEECEELRGRLAGRLRDLRRLTVEQLHVDSPIFQLLGEWKPGSLARLKTDVFRDQVQINETYRGRMAEARASGVEAGVPALRAIRRKLGDLDIGEAGVLIDLLLSFRALKAWDDMVELCGDLPEALKRQVLVREQRAFALNRRAGQTKNRAERDLALEILQGVEAEQGASPETCGLIGRIYKDLWDETRVEEQRASRVYLKHAINAYRRGFDADWRDAYPGINAVTLLDVLGGEKALAERDRLLPVVRFAVQRRLQGRQPDYWDHATMLELAVLASEPEAADEFLDEALAAVREPWEPETTARNLRLIAEARASRGEEVAWIEELVKELDAKAT